MQLQVGPDKEQYEMYQNADYQSFWDGVARQKMDELERILVRNLLELPARRLIDVGCGFGRMADVYFDRAEQVAMLDSSTSLLQQARSRTGGRALYIACNLPHIPFADAAFDRALMIRVFHHLPDGRASLQELNRILGQGGRLVFTYCNKANLKQIVKWLEGKRTFNPFQPEPGYVWDAFLMHHPRSIRQMLAEIGLKQVKLRGSGFLDKLAGRLGRLGSRLPPGVALSTVAAYSGVAPWIFCQAAKPTGQTQAAESSLESLLRCPTCHGVLAHPAGGYTCEACQRLYPEQDGIINFLPDNQRE
jgi:SAM-dependent methyltransferase/uncharacterized protein YbaR (Trm112 family)